MPADAPRPYRPHLASPTSYDSLRPPPGVTTWSEPSASTSPSSSSVGMDFAQHQPPGRRGMGGHGAPPSRTGVLVRKQEGKERVGEHEVLEMGGTGVIKAKGDPGRLRKRIILMIICGTVICAIIVLVVLGCKGQL